MNQEKKAWIITITSSVLIAIGLGALIYFQQENLKERRAEAEQLRQVIAQHRELIKTTPELVKKVIIQRETDNVIREILSDEEDVNNLVRTLHRFGEETEIAITSLKPRRKGSSRNTRQAFDQVGYTLSFDADGFQLLSLLDRIERHPRFMSVTSFKLQAAGRSDYNSETEPRHRVTLDVETYVYKPTGNVEKVKIDNFERKRDLLVSEISKRTNELRLKNYDYQGQRGRRDPWIDPRVPVEQDGAPTLSIEEQFAIVDELVERTDAAKMLVEELDAATNVIEEMKARSKLEEDIAFLDEEILRVRTEGLLVFVSAAKRFETQVVEVVDALREDILNAQRGQGPSLAALRQAVEGMERHIAAQEYEIAQEIYATIEPGLALAEREELKRPLVQGVRELHLLTVNVLEFESIQFSVDGVAIYEGRRPVALINGTPVTEGELVGDEAIIRRITPEQIEFSFRGLVLARLVNSETIQ